jgi:hypothetical protein
MDGGYVITGCTYSIDGTYKGNQYGLSENFIHKLDNNGNTKWVTKFGGSSPEFIEKVISTDDSCFVVVGNTMSNDGDYIGKNPFINEGTFQIIIAKFNNLGEKLWMWGYGGSDSEYCNSVIQTKDKGYIITGSTSSNDYLFRNMRTLDKTFSDIFILKLDSNGILNNTTSINEFSESTTTLSVHPNPFSNSTTISYKVDTPSNVRIELLNTLGQTIEVLREDYTDIGTYQLPLNVSTLSSGMYSVRMRSGSMNEVVPVWVVR